MPFQGLGAPPPAHGITSSAPLNLGIGGAVAAGSNALTLSQFGPDVTGVSFVINLIFQWLKLWEHFDQHRHWPIIILVLGILAFWLITGGDLAQSIIKGGIAAMQSAANYAGQKAAGLGILEPSTKYPGSKE